MNRYDVSGLSGEEFEAAARTILSEPNVDNVYDENYKISSEYHVFATEFLPGQYDQRADSASQCVQLLTQGERPQVAYAKVIAVKGDLSEEEMEKIKNYIVNPVESRLASMEKPETLDMKIDVPADVKRVTGMISWSDEELREYYGTMGAAPSKRHSASILQPAKSCIKARTSPFLSWTWRSSARNTSKSTAW